MTLRTSGRGGGASAASAANDALNTSEHAALSETIAGIEAQIAALGTPEATPALVASIASLAAQVAVLDIPPVEPLQAALVSLTARLDALVIPGTGGLAAAVAGLQAAVDAAAVPLTDGVEVAIASQRAALDAIAVPTAEPLEAALAGHQSQIDEHTLGIATGLSERSGISETIAGIEARLLSMETTDPVPDAYLEAAVASLAAQVAELDIPALAPVESAVASIVARLDALPMVNTAGLATSVAGLQASLDAIVESSIAPIEAATAGQQSQLDGHKNYIATGASERTGLAETVAGIEARTIALEDAADLSPGDDNVESAISGLQAALDALDIPTVTPLEASLAGLQSRDDVEASVRDDADEAITETIAGIEAELGRGKTFTEIEVAEFDLTAATGVYEAVPGTDVTLQPGSYRITVFGGAAMIAATVGTTLRIRGRLFNVTDNVVIGREQLCGGNFNTTRVLTAFSHTFRFDVVSTITVRYEGARQFINAPTESFIFGHNPAGIMLVEYVV